MLYEVSHCDYVEHPVGPYVADGAIEYPAREFFACDFGCIFGELESVALHAEFFCGIKHISVASPYVKDAFAM